MEDKIYPLQKSQDKDLKKKFDNLHFKKTETKKIKRLQRQLSKKQKGSNNRKKARIKLAKLYKKINDRKQYYLHAVSKSLIDENQVICMEDLNVKGMIKNHNPAESICEVNHSQAEDLWACHRRLSP